MDGNVQRVCDLWYDRNVGGSRNVDLFFFKDTATTRIYTLPLRAALPISLSVWVLSVAMQMILVVFVGVGGFT